VPADHPGAAHRRAQRPAVHRAGPHGAPPARAIRTRTAIRNEIRRPKCTPCTPCTPRTPCTTCTSSHLLSHSPCETKQAAAQRTNLTAGRRRLLPADPPGFAAIPSPRRPSWAALQGDPLRPWSTTVRAPAPPPPPPPTRRPTRAARNGHRTGTQRTPVAHYDRLQRMAAPA
jgi:hypothetical protein